MKLDDDEDKYGDVIDKYKVYCAELRQSRRESIPVERLEPQWDNDKSHFKVRKDNKVIFEDYMPNMKINMNNILLTQTIKNSTRMEYSDKTVKLIPRVIGDLINNTMEEGTSFAQGCFLHKGFKSLDGKCVR